MFPLTFSPTRSHDEKELMSVVDPDVHAIYEHSMNRSKTNESVCTEANVWMQRNDIFCVCTVHESRKKASLLCDTTLAFSFIIHVSFSVSLYYSVGSNSQTDRSKQFFSRERKINTTGCIQTVYDQGPPFFSFSFFLIMSSSSMFHFSRSENRFNRFSLTTNMQSTFCSTDMTFVVGVYF